MKTKNKKNLRKKIIILESIFVIGILIYLFFSTAPAQIYPLNGMIIINPDIVFEIENANKILISIDEQFTNPIVLKEGSDIVLPPGTYYWKLKGLFRESEVRSFTVKGHVGLTLKERLENFELENAGNVDLNVTRKNQNDENLKDFELGVGEFVKVEKDDSKYEGEQK